MLQLSTQPGALKGNELWSSSTGFLSVAEYPSLGEADWVTVVGETFLVSAYSSTNERALQTQKTCVMHMKTEAKGMRINLARAE